MMQAYTLGPRECWDCWEKERKDWGEGLQTLDLFVFLMQSATDLFIHSV